MQFSALQSSHFKERALLIALRISESFDHVCTNPGHKIAQATVNVHPQYGTYFMLPLWHQNFEADLKFWENFGPLHLIVILKYLMS